MLRRFGKGARLHLGAMAVDSFFNGVSRVAKLHPKARPARHGVHRDVDIPYRGTGMPEHLLDVYRPQSSEGPLPIVFYVHGGGFRILSKDTHWVMGLAFARRGYLVFNVSYRLAPKHRFPAAIEDVCHAYTWVLENAERFGGDPSRVVLAGESAGANLVTSLALTQTYERPEPFARAVYETGSVARAVIASCGVFQVSDIERLRRRKPHMSPFVADRLNEVTENYLGREPPLCSLDLADPVVALERGERSDRPLPPFFLPVGTRDPLLPDTRRLASALEAHGAPVDARYYPGELHAFHAFVMLPAAKRCWAHTYAFLDRHVPRISTRAVGGHAAPAT